MTTTPKKCCPQNCDQGRDCPLECPWTLRDLVLALVLVALTALPWLTLAGYVYGQ